MSLLRLNTGKTLNNSLNPVAPNLWSTVWAESNIQGRGPWNLVEDVFWEPQIGVHGSKRLETADLTIYM